MKSVMLSIRPKWCKKIIDGEKAIEVRKTKPKLETPFKCYIYCTNSGVATGMWGKHGKVVGEFTCNTVTNLFSNSRFWLNEDDVLQTCLSAAEMRKYADGAHGLYGWHISDLVCYDKPKELSEFKGLRKTKFGYEPVEIKRPPQSWCYVEEREGKRIDEITYMDCWHFIAPLIPIDNAYSRRVYVTVFHALKEAEERRVEENDG